MKRLDLNMPSRTEAPKPSGSGSLLQTIKQHVGWESGSTRTKEHGTGTNFDKIVETATSYEGINVSLYKSRETGLKVLIADVPTPCVHGYFTLATEILNDSGCPHTLEHLIFLGSDQYPYKGMLDTIANRCFAQGTNAWTDTDHTAYTIYTVGQEAFLQILPVYIDHILYATITSAGCLTEVHHINGEGKDAGVVYCEMQGRQNQQMDLMELAKQRLMFPEGSGYRSETGGLMEALRVLKVETIRDYHANYYVPQNLTLVIVGNVDHAGLLHTLQDKVESSILAKGKPDLSHWKRPWVFSPSVPSLNSSHSKVVEFPEEDESMGEFLFTCFGPEYDDVRTCVALDILADYLSDSEVSILSQTFVEVEDPVTTNISFYTRKQLPCTISIYFESVPVEHLDSVEDQLTDVFRKVAKEGIDMERMAIVIRALKNRWLLSVEQGPASTISGKLINEAIYGTLDGKTLSEDLKDLIYFDKLANWTSEEWIALLQKWLIDNPHITILGKPSANLAKTLEQNELSRIEAQRKSLGENGLLAKKRKLEQAQEENDKPIPQDLIRKFKVPRISSIKFIETTNAVYIPRSARKPPHRNEIERILDGEGSDHPLNLVFSHTSTQFVTVTLYITTKDLPAQLLPYLELYLDSFFAWPVMRDGQLVEYEEVVKEVNRFTVDKNARLGVEDMAEVIMITLRAEKSRYQEIIGLLSDLFVRSVFNPERLAIEVSKAQNDIPATKRDGDDMARNVKYTLHLDEHKSAHRANSVLRQESLLNQLEKEMEDQEDNVAKRFETLRAELIKVERLRINVIADVLTLEKPVSAWENFLPSAKDKFLLPIPRDIETLTPQGLHPSGDAYIVRLATQESTYLVVTTTGIPTLEHPDAAALIATLAWINMLEGYMWKRVRGAGLAYGAGITSDFSRGQLVFKVYRSPNGYLAWHEAQKIIAEIASGEIVIDETELESAKSSHVYSVARNMNTNLEAARMGYINEFIQGLPKDHPLTLLKKIIEEVTVDDCKRIVTEYLIKLFSVETSDIVCVSAPTTVDEIAKSFDSRKFRTQVKNLEDFQ